MHLCLVQHNVEVFDGVLLEIFQDACILTLLIDLLLDLG
jgi:hypothetical protein